MTPSQIKAAYQSHGHDGRYFFDRKTMQWFGDRMTSFGTRTIGGVTYLYRKPSATVNVFGNYKRAGREFFNAWRFDPVDDDLHYCDREMTQRVYDTVAV